MTQGLRDIFNRLLGRWRAFGRFVKFHTGGSDYTIEYQGQTQQQEQAATGTVVARMTGRFKLTAVTVENSALQWMIDPFAEPDQKQAGAQRKGGQVVAKIDFNNYGNQRYRCSECGACLVPVVDFQVLKGVIQISSYHIIHKNVSGNVAPETAEDKSKKEAGK